MSTPKEARSQLHGVFASISNRTKPEKEYVAHSMILLPLVETTCSVRKLNNGNRKAN